MSKVVDVISRKTAVKTALASEGNLSVSLHEPSVVIVHASAHDVARYERAGKDLLIHMKDGSVIRCDGYFIEDSEQNHGELVFQDDATQTLTHVEFADTGDAMGLQSIILHPTETALTSLDPLMIDSTFSDLPWGMIAAGVLGGGAVGALLAHSGNDGGGTTIIDNTKDVEVANPTFLVSDKQGDRQGLLSTDDVTDDTQPTFSGTGQPGASIQIKDASGSVIASAQVAANGTWSAQLPAQSAGTHQYSVVQINGDKTTSAGDITLNVVTANAALTLDTLAGDNVLNAAEQGAALTVSGHSTELASGTALTVTLNGKTYQTTVGDNGAWSLSVPATDAAALADGVHTVAVSGKDAAGNTISGSTTLTVDTQPPSLAINTVSTDDMINAAESGQALVLNGTTDAEAGQKVTVTLNGKSYEATVNADGSWNTTVPSADVATLTNGDYAISATVSDKAGNSSSTEHAITADITVPTVSIDTIAGDNVINGLEHVQAQTISGSGTGAAAGDKVTVTIDGHTYTTLLDANGNWSIGVPADVIKGLTDGSYTVGVSITDAAGNTGSHTQEITVTTTRADLTVDTLAENNVINAGAKGQDLTLSGTSNLADGTQVTITLNGKEYTATVNGGLWNTRVPAADVALLGEARYTLNLSATDEHGNPTSITHSVQVDSALPVVVINSVTSDDILNEAEIGSDQTISGRVTGAAAGDTVTVTVGGKTYSATVEADLSWKVTVSSQDLTALGDGELSITASVTNSHGNTGDASRDILIDANLPGLRIDTVAGDDIINAIEHHQNLIVTGTSTDLAPGSSITVSINGVDYPATIKADGSWSAAIPVSDVANWPAGGLNVSASGTDSSGNPVQTDHGIDVDLSPVAIAINPVTADNVLNAAEKGADLTLSGTSQNVEAGQTVTLNFAGHTYTATVDANGVWSTTVPAADMANLKDGDTNVTVSVTNVNGNSAGAGQWISVDATAPVLSVDNITSDNILNAAEAGADLTLSGTSTAEAGQTVTVKLNGVEYTATVRANGNWSTTVPQADLANLTDGDYRVEASVADKAGNPSAAARDVLVDVTAPVVGINITAGDNVINATEHGQAQIITGTSSGTVAGDSVLVTVGGHEYTTTVDASGNWSVGVPAGVVQGLADGTVSISASITDKAGNTGSAQQTVTVNTAIPALTIDTLAGDDVVNAVEKGADLLLSGTSNLADGSLVNVSLNGTDYAATVTGGVWRTTVPASDVAKLGEANYRVTASTTDVNGNNVSATHDVLVDSAIPTVVINAVTADNVLNAAEVAVDQVISGRVTGAAAGDTVTVTVGGKTYSATVEADLSWKVTVASQDLTALGDGDLTITASVTNVHGNSGDGSRDISVDANLPGLRIDTVAGDDIINAIEHNQNLIVTGTSSDLPAGSTITVSINSVDYQASVMADGSWSAAVPASDVSQWPAGSVTIGAVAADTSGNPVNIGHNVTVDLSNVAVSIDSVTADNVLNAAEKGADLTISGSTLNVEAGQTVNVQFAGHSYTATVGSDGAWSVTVPAADMTKLKDGDTNVTVSVTNVNGNSAGAGQWVSVDATAPVLSVDNITSDNMLNAAEAGADLTLSGTSTAEAGQTVTVKLNGVEYTATVQANGNWSTTVPQADLANLTDGDYRVEASVADKAGNPSAAVRDVLVDVTAPVVTINTVAGDNVINATEHGQAQIITGTSSGTVAGDSVLVTVGGHEYTTTVDASGNWSVGVPAGVVQGLADGTVSISASITDKAGNTGTDAQNLTVNTQLPTFTIDAITGDNVLNDVEKASDQTISGTASGLADGAKVTVTLNGVDYPGTVAGGIWSVNVPAANLSALGEAIYQVNVSGTDAVGNSNSQGQSLQVASTLPGVAIDSITSDDVLNAAEIAVEQVISGHVTAGAAAGDTVTVNIGGKAYQATVESDLSWKVTVPSTDLVALGNGDLTVTASVTDVNGNTGNGSRDINVDANLPGLRIDTVAGDDVINSIEQGQNLIITGSSSDLAPGSSITVALNGKSYAATILADGSWSAAIPANDVSNLSAGNLNITAQGSSSAGNPVSISHTVNVDLASVAVSIDAVTADNVLNAAEKGADLTLTGSTHNVEAGQIVHVTFAGQTYQASVEADGSWKITVPAANMTNLKDGEASVVANVANVAGNTASAAQQYDVDATAPVISINNITADNVLNAAEAGADLVLTGTSTAEAGQTVIVKLNGVDYTATVQADGTWSTTVPQADLVNLTDGDHRVEASVADKAGNPSNAARDVAVDTTPPTVSFNTVAGDDVINLAEHGQAQIVSGSSTGAAAGDKVLVTLDGKTYTTTVDASGNWSVGVPANVVSGLNDGTHSIDVSITDAAGNTGTGSHDVVVNTGVPGLSFNALAVDNVLNAIEKGEALTVSGSASNLADGTTVNVNLNGSNYTTTVTGGQWTLNVPAGDVAKLGEANYTLTVSATNDIGNSISNTADLLVDTAAPTVVINPVTFDDVLNASEVASGQDISGRVSGAAAGDTVTINVGGKTYTAIVQADLSWKVNVPASDLTAMGNGELSVTASVTNAHGNTGDGARDFVIDANLPGLRITTVAGDDIINAIEHDQNLIVSGGSTGLTAGSGVTVTINGNDYLATILADGSWNAAVPSADVAQWAAGTVIISAAGSSSAGNPVLITHNVTVDLSAVAISINAVTGDNVLNAAEKGGDLVLSGETQNVEAGQTVNVQFAGHTYTATVAADGSWKVTVPSADMRTLIDSDVQLQVSVNNAAGNTASAAQGVHVDVSAPALTINNITADNVLNAAEAGADLVLTGTSTAEAGQTVTVKLNGVEYTATVQADGNWSTTVAQADLANLSDGDHRVEASVADKAGNPSTAARDVSVDTTPPTASFNTVAGDDVINLAEHGQAQIVSGSSTGAAAGDKVLVTLDGKTYTTTVDASGNWSVGVPANVVKGLADGTFTLTASITDAAGNTGLASHDIEVNAASVTLSIDTLAQDDVINAAEKGAALTISGDSTLLPSGTVVTVTLNGVSYTTTVLLNGSWTLDVPASDVAKLAEGALTVTASAHDSAGNSAATSHNISVDSVAPTLSIDTLSGDDRLNAAERGQDLTVKGSTSAEAGQTVTVTLNGKDYTATVNADGTWSLSVPAADLATLTDGNLTVSATVNDKAGNGVSQTHDLMVDTTAPTLTFDIVAGDDVINSAEQLAGQTLSGKTDAEAGQPVVVIFNHREYNTTVAADGTWKISVPASDFLGATDGSYVINVTTTDVAGNRVSDSKTITLSGAAPTISISTFAGDDVVSAAEHGTSHVISGTTTGAATGQTVTITLNGQSYTTTVAADGSWKYTLSASAVQALADGDSYVINASVSNGIGNSASDQHDIRVDTTAPSMGIAINSIDGDSGLSSTDFITGNNQVTMKGSLTATPGNDEKAQISLDGGATWIDLAVNGTAWTYAQGVTLADGTYTYTVRVIDAAGNVGATASQDVVIDTVAPDASKSISIDALSRDTGLDSHDFITSDNTLTLSGKLGAALASDEHAQISIDGGKTWADVNISGLSWTYVDGRTLADGDYNYQLRVIDQAGNVGATANQVVTVDTTPPDASKTITIDGISDDTGLSGNDFITSDQTLTVHGSLATSLLDDETVQISLDGGATWLSTTVIGTQWSYVDGRTLTDGVHQYIVRVVDQAGNVGQTATQNVTVDTVAPDASETISIDGITHDTGLSDSDFITSDTSLTLNGSLGAKLADGEVAQISTDNGATWTTVTVTGTTWTYTDGRTLTDGSYTYQMRVVDQAGNVGQTASQEVIVDTTAPTQTMTVDAISADTGASASDFITSDTSLTLSGSFSAAPGSDERGQISLDGGNTWQFVNVSGKNWTFDDGRTLTDGVYHYQVRVIDTAGNVSATGNRDVTIDTMSPDATPTINTYTDDTGERQGSFGANVITDDNTPLLTGSLSTGLATGEILEIWRNGVMVGHATVNGTVWTFADTLGADGTYQYIAKAVDLAGNITDSSEFDLTLDTSIPTTTAAVNALNTADTTPILTGTVSADLVNGQYVVVTVNGVTYSSEEGGRVVVDPAANTWYLQVPDSATLGLQTYDVTAQVKSGAGNGNNTSIAHGSLIVGNEIASDTSWASTAGNSNNNGAVSGINSAGLWQLDANQMGYSSSDLNSFSGSKMTNTRGYYVVGMTASDYDRNGTADIFATENNYGNSTQIMWTNNGSSYTGSQLAMGTTIWYGGVIAYDKTGDGYLDLAYGDAGGDSRTYLVNNKGVMGVDGSGGTAGLSIITYRELSGIDINNDGIVDLVQHTNGSGTNALSIINNNGTGKLTVGQSIANVFVNNAANTTNGASMTWADFNGDGYMDLYIGSGTGAQTGGVIYYNNGDGTLSTTKSQVEASNASAGYVSAAVDWNGDGQMDIIKLSTYGGSQTATLFTNNNKGASWSSSVLKTGLANVTGIATMDYNWDGAVDLLVSQVNGKVQLIENTNKIAEGTAIHLRILDGEGINVFYGNTVQLFNSAGILVASEVINAQSGLGTNDTSALVNFYGLDPSETYSAVLVRAINGVSSNATWDGLVAGDGKESYSLTADAATGGHSGTITGTGYNDTFIAEEGSYTYVGSGGWDTTSNHATWSATGGEDIVDFRNSTVGITVDLSNTGAQNTGYNTATFNGIEGIAGTDHDDVITGNSGNNIFEGRGGNDTFNIGNGGHDTLLYKLINSTDATGGNGSDTVNGFTVGTWEGTADTDRVDISELLQGSGYTGSGGASYVNGVATLDSAAGNIGDYVKVTTSGSDTVIEIDRDGSGASYAPTTVLTLTGVHTDLAILLANHQLTVV